MSLDKNGKRQEPLPSSDPVAEQIMKTIAPWFDREFYLATNPDVAEQHRDPLVHFYEYGEQEGRKPRADFDPAYYLATNPDVKQIQSGNALESACAIHPFFHYVAMGKAEGRSGVPAGSSPQGETLVENGVREHILKTIAPWFDREFYLAAYPDVAGLGIDPLAHFYDYGEQQGYRPRADFDPLYYLAVYRDVKYVQPNDVFKAAMAVHPFFHYVIAGRNEGRQGAPSFESLHLDECDLPPDIPAEKIAVAAHLFYPDIWDEIHRLITTFPLGTRLYISLVEGYSDHLAGTIRAMHPGAQIEVVKNRGRDVLPFLSQLDKIQADGVLFALKIHSKKSLYNPEIRGDEWRASLYGELAASTSRVNAIIRTFSSMPDIGVLIPHLHCIGLAHCMEENRSMVDRLAVAMGISVVEQEMGEIGFPAGTMFWFRPEALLPLKELKLSADDFPEESGQTDCTLAHAIERIISLSAKAARFETRNYRWKPKCSPDSAGGSFNGNGKQAFTGQSQQPYDPSRDPDISYETPKTNELQTGPDGLPLPSLELSTRIGSPTYGNFLEIGAMVKDCIVRSLPPDWDFKGKRVLDFGCGIGRVLRHFSSEARDAEIWGCDIDMRSVMWLNEHLSPPFHIFQNSESAALPLESGSFDLVIAISVFTHLNETWNQWLTELHRILKPGGYAFFSFLNRGPYESIYRKPFPAEEVGMLVKQPNQTWDLGGPTVFISPQWLGAHWGKLFEIEWIGLGGLGGYQSIAFMRKPQPFSRPGSASFAIHQMATHYEIKPDAMARISNENARSGSLVGTYGLRGRGAVRITGWGAFKGGEVSRIEFTASSHILAGTSADHIVKEGELSELENAPRCKFDQMLDVSKLTPGHHTLKLNFIGLKGETYWAETPLIIEA